MATLRSVQPLAIDGFALAIGAAYQIHMVLRVFCVNLVLRDHACSVGRGFCAKRSSPADGNALLARHANT